MIAPGIARRGIEDRRGAYKRLGRGKEPRGRVFPCARVAAIRRGPAAKGDEVDDNGFLLHT